MNMNPKSSNIDWSDHNGINFNKNFYLYFFHQKMITFVQTNFVLNQARLAQMVERAALNRAVVGSTPTAGVSFFVSDYSFF